MKPGQKLYETSVQKNVLEAWPFEKLSDEIKAQWVAKEYLSGIGSVGGKKSRRKLTKKEARRIALIGWEKRREAAARFREGMGR